MKVVIGQGSCGVATGARKTAAEFEKQIAEKNLDVKIDITGCVGTCYLEPIVDVYEDNGEMTRYVKVQPENVAEIVDSHLAGGKPAENVAISSEDKEFINKQHRVVLRNCGLINPEKIEEYTAVGGYKAAEKAVTQMTPDEVIEEIKISGLRGRGGAAFGAMGTEKSKGTKVFALAGKIKKGGLVEVPMGLPLKDVIFGIGGGIKNDKEFKAVQMGGPSGGCIPASLIDTPVTYEDINKTGAIVGSGGMIVMDENTCMVDMARYFLDFTRKESCGKCNYCRIGTKRMLEILERITQGKGQDGDIEKLEELAMKIKDGSLCGLGQTAPNPVLTTLKYFRNEYEDHIYNKKCTAKSCTALISFEITDACKGCTLCARNCPVDAISGKVKEKHIIDKDKCIKCGKCEEHCKFGAIIRK